jgi:hypothetical protein
MLSVTEQIARVKSDPKLYEIWCQMQLKILNRDRRLGKVIDPKIIEKMLDQCEKSKKNNFYT